MCHTDQVSFIHDPYPLHAFRTHYCLYVSLSNCDPTTKLAILFFYLLCLPLRRSKSPGKKSGGIRVASLLYKRRYRYTQDSAQVRSSRVLSRFSPHSGNIFPWSLWGSACRHYPSERPAARVWFVLTTHSAPHASSLPLRTTPRTHYTSW